jgi:hypothetical protein
MAVSAECVAQQRAAGAAMHRMQHGAMPRDGVHRFKFSLTSITQKKAN